MLSGVGAVANAPERPCRVLAYREAIPAGLAGAYVSLTSNDRALQVGFLSDWLGWRELARDRTEDGAAMRNAIVAQAEEFVVAAARALVEADGHEFVLGLPLFVEGTVAPGAQNRVQAADIVLGTTRALLVLLAPHGMRAFSLRAGSMPPEAPRARASWELLP
jgi:hypothetical protein